MAPSPRTPGIVAGRLDPEAIAANFADLSPPLRARGAGGGGPLLFLPRRALHDGLPDLDRHPPLHPRDRRRRARRGGAHDPGQNILGGMCARVCPTETLCEAACVREAAEGKPVEIGQLQRFATDGLMARGGHPFSRAEPTGKRVAVVGAGPAGLACAHRLAMLGHDVVVFEARAKGGGLNEYGIAAYKTVAGFAQAELDWLLRIGGIELRTGRGSAARSRSRR